MVVTDSSMGVPRFRLFFVRSRMRRQGARFNRLIPFYRRDNNGLDWFVRSIEMCNLVEDLINAFCHVDCVDGFSLISFMEGVG